MSKHPFSVSKKAKANLRRQLAQVRQVFMVVIFLTSLVGMNTTPVKADSTGLVCETFESFTPGSTIGTYTGWYSDGSGPSVTSGVGVAGSVGLGSGGSIFNWTAHPFNWNDADLETVVFQGDFKTDSTGKFDDDRLSWTTNGSNVSSNYEFGVQLDHTNGGIVTYWSNVIGQSKVYDVIVPLTAGGTGGTQINTWYRFTAEITKLTATSASIDVSLVQLDASGNPTGTPITGLVADTSALASGHTPAAGYFTATSMVPSYKNYTTAAGPADNVCYEVTTTAPVVQHTLTVTTSGSGSVTLDPAGGTYDENTVVTLTPAPAAGWEFDSWSGANSGDLTDNGNGTWSITMDTDKAVTATFTELPLVCYALTLGHTGNGTDPVAAPDSSAGCPAGEYIVGESVSLSGAVPDSGWQISSWYGTSNDTSTANTNTLTMPASTLSAGVNYSEIPPVDALDFGTGTAYVTFGDASALDLPQFTLETWFRRDGAGVTTTTGSGGVTNAIPLVTKGRGEADDDNRDMNYFLGIRASDNVLVADFEEGTGGGDLGLNHPVIGVTPIVTGQWYHAAATYNGNKWQLFLNGKLEKELVVGYPVRWDSIQHAALGTALNSSGVSEGHFDGVLDEARIWNYARSQAEIISEVNSEITTATTGLVGRWALDEGTGTTVYGSAGTTVNGTIMNSGYTWVEGAPFDITPPAQFTLTVNTSGNGSVTLSPAGGTYYEGTVVQLTAVPDSGWSFSAWSGDLTGSTNPTTITMSADKTVTATFIEGGTITFQEGVSGYAGTIDTYLYGINPSTGHGTDAQFMWDTDSSGGAQYGLLRFNDIFGTNPGQIPVGATILSATLTYVVFNEGDTANVNEVAVDWTESSTYADFGGDSGVQADEYGTLIGTAPGATPLGAKTVNVTASLAAWASNPTSNRGWIFIPTATNGVQVRSSEYGTVSERPLLTVTYSSAGANHAPDQPALVQPADGATDISTSPTLEVTVSDTDSDPLDVTYYGREASGAGEDFTIVFLPDTQFYSQDYPNTFDAQTDWIVANREALNIVYVAHAGDIVNTYSSTTQWANADDSMSRLENPATTGLADGIPYGIQPGNHDMATTLFNSTFGYSRFEGRGYYGGHYSTDNDNNYTLFSAGGMDFIVVNLEYSPSADILDWADARLKEYSTRRAIVVSHEMTGTGNPSSWQGQGSAIYTALSDNTNLFLMLCGHVSGEGQRTDTSGGSTIHTLLADYQSYTNGGNGYLRILQFSPETNTISVKTYSPTLNAYETDTNSQFSLSYGMDGGEAYQTIGSDMGVASGEAASIAWPGRALNTEYEWYVDVSDGSATTTGPTWSFTTIPPACYELTLGHTGNGTDPASDPANSDGCTSGYYVEGEVINLSGATPDAGWHISGWTGTSNDASTAATNTLTMPAAAHSAGVAYARDAVTLTVSVTGSGSVNQDPAGPYLYGDVVQLTAVPVTGWHFSGWSGDLGGTTNPENITLNGDKTVTAAFEKDTVTLTVNVSGSGSVNQNPAGPYLYGDIVELTATPATGWAFSGWSGDLGGTTNPEDITLNGNKTVTATFEPLCYTLTLAVDPPASGSIAADPAPNCNAGTQYTYGTAVELTASASAGYGFDHWSGALSGSTNPQTVTLDADKAVTAVFALNAVSLTVNVTGSGTVTQDPAGPYYTNDVVQLTAVPATGWHFSGWSGDLSGTDNPANITLTGDKTVSATFERDTVTLTVNVTGNGTVIRDPAGPYLYGDVVQLTPAPATGWHFSGWSGDLSGTDNPASITLNGNKTLTAAFEKDPVTLTVNITGSGTVIRDPVGPYVYGDIVQLTPAPDTGWHFSGWSGDLSGADNPASITLNGDKTVTAAFEKDPVTLTVNVTGNGSVGQNPAGPYLYGDTVELTATADTGWTFSGWSGGLSGNTNPENITLNGDKTVTATFEELPPDTKTCESFNAYTPGSTIGSYTGWYDAGSGPVVTSGVGVASSIGLGSATSIFNWTAHPFNWNDAAFTGINFQGDFKTDSSGRFDDDRLSWTTNGTSNSSNNQFGVQLDHVNGGIVTYWSNVIGGSKVYDVIVPLTAGGTGGTQINTWYRFTAEITKLTATSARIDVTLVQLDASGNPTGTPITGSIADTSGLASGHTPAAGYFTATSMVPSYKNYTSYAAPADNVCYEVETGTPPPQYTLTVNISGSGSVTLDPSGGTYDEGTVVQLTAVPATGWAFSSWSGDLTGSTNPTTITMDADKTVTATFVQVPPVALTVNTVGNGSVTLDPSGGTYAVGTVVQLTAVPDTGWAFSGWSGDLAGTTNPASITMDAAKTITATFEEQPPVTTVCETFDTFTPGSTIGTYTGWYDGNNGPVVTSGVGVGGSTGLGSAANIFNWTANPFSWTDPSVLAVNLQADFKTDSTGKFDDDRLGWTINGTSTDSSNQFGVQLDHPEGGISTYWRNSSNVRVQNTIVSLPTLTTNTWYRFRAEITKLTDASAQIDVSLVQLDAGGNPTGTAYTGTVPDTSTWAGGAPNAKYFPTTDLWPTYKNYTAQPGPADNVCYELETGTPPPQHTLTVNTSGSGSVTLNPSGGVYYEGTVVQLTAVPATGWAFSGWSGDLGGSTNPTTITMDADKIVTATFVQVPPVALTVNTVGNGSVTLDPSGGTYAVGTVVQLTAVPDTNWAFSGWSGDLTGSTNPASITMNAAKTVTATFVELPPTPSGVCEGFETGFTLGQVVGAHAEWYDSGSGPVVTSGIGLASSIGLAPGSSIFNWTEHPFDWNDPAFESITFSMDYQTDASGHFDDDRLGWTINGNSSDSANQFGVQLDHSDGGIVTFWRNSSGTRIQTPIVALSALPASTWYRLQATIAKLTDTSARIDVSLVQLDASGNPTGTAYTGTVDDTSTWADGTPKEDYFTATSMWPTYKNHSAIQGAADNVCFDIVSGRFAFVVTSDWHTSDTYPNGSITTRVQQIKTWIDNPTTEMPEPEFMVITGDFPHLTQTDTIINDVLGSDFLWYPVIGNHEMDDLTNDFNAIRDTFVPTLPNIVDHGPTGSVNTTYSWDYENSHFIAINPFWDGASNDHTSGGDIPPALNTWVNTDLTNNAASHNFAFIHTPPFPSNRHVGEDLDANPVNRAAFIATLNAHSVESIFSGHTHYYEHNVAPEFDLGALDQITNGSLRSGGVPVTITYVLVEGNTTTYKVYAESGGTFSLYDQWVIGGSIPTQPPAAPTGLTATADSYARVSLAWEDNADNETGFEIERSTTGSSGSFSLLTTAAIDAEAYTNVGLTELSEYCYRVRAINAAGNSAYSDVACATTPEQPPIVGICETFDTFTPGSTIGTYTGWYDGNNGPVVTSGVGVGGSTGLGSAANIFNWTANPFSWTDPSVLAVNLQADFKTDSTGKFDDDRLGWTINGTSTDSSNQFGVQLDHPEGGISTYWRNSSNVRVQNTIVSLPTLTANTWYRFRAEITKLTDASAQIDVSLVQLDASGNPTGTAYTGTVPDTSTWAGGAPNAKYFPTTDLWPTYKNYTAQPGPADNVCYEIETGTPPPQHTLTVNTSGSGSVTLNPSGGVYYEGRTVQLTAVPATGWVFDGWSGDLTGTANPASIVMNTDKTVTATFLEQPRLVGYWKFDEGTGTAANDSSYYGNHGTVTEAAWTTGKVNGALSFDGTNDRVQIPDSSSLSLSTNQATFAAWIKADTFPSSWATVLQRSRANGFYDFQIYARASDAPLVNRPVCRFDWDKDWTVDADEQVGGDIILQPDTWYFLACTYDGSAMKFYIDGTLRGTTAKTGGVINDSGKNIWIGSNESWGEPFDGIIDEVYMYNRALTLAEIQSIMQGLPPEQHTLTVNITGSGSVTRNPDKTAYNHGEVVELTAVPATGWHFSSWSGDLSGTANPASITMGADRTVTATFEKDPVTLTVNVIGSGSVNQNPAEPYLYGDVVQLTAVPAAGWHFSGWSGDLSSTTNPENITLNGNKTVTATFVKDTVTLTINVIGSGTIIRDPAGPYLYGETVQLTPVPDTGWHFSGWSGDLSGTDNPASLTLDGDKTVTATFEKDTVTLTVNVVGNGSVVQDPEGPYLYGDTVELTADPDEDWYFDSWSGDLSGPTNPASIVLNGNKTVTATFTEVPPTCFTLTLGHTGNGSDPVSLPANSTSCAAGQYVAGEVINLSGATPGTGWQIDSWTGTDNDASTASTNTLTMPAAAHTVEVNYVESGPGPGKITSYSNATYDGWVLESTETSGVGGSKNNTNITFNLGDDAADRQYRSILHFYTGGVPDNAVITKVTLKVKRQGVIGTDPFTTHGNIFVDMRKRFFGTGKALQVVDFEATPGLLKAGVIMNTPVNNWYTVIFDSSAFNYIDKAGATQFRLRFSLADNDDMGADYLKFYSSNTTNSANRPRLIIEYTLP